MYCSGIGKAFVKRNFPALTHSDFRYFWSGQCISLIGTWMQNVGQSWLIYTITDSPFLTGLAGAVQFLPVMMFSLFAGIIIDKYPKRKILLFTQSTSMLLALALSALVFTGVVQYWHILILGFLLGCNNTIDMPTRQSFTIEIAGKEDLMNAVALNSTVFNLARILGPGIGGLILGSIGAGWCFLLNGLSFIAVLYGLTKIKAAPFIREKKTDSNVLHEIMEGLSYISKEAKLIRTLSMVAVIGIFIFNFNVIIPVFTKEVLDLDGKTYGFLMSSLGAGSLIGALSVSLRSKRGPQMRTMLISSVLLSLFLAVVGFTRTYYMAGLFLAITGIFNLNFTTTANSTLQLNSKDEFRSRVMSVYALVFAGATPLGNLFAGFISDRFGAAAAFTLSGVIALVLLAIINIVVIPGKAKAAAAEKSQAQA